MTPLLQILKSPRSRTDRQALLDEACGTNKSCDLVGVSLAGCDISDLWLARLRIQDVDFRGSVCHGTTFPPLVNCVMDGVDATKSHFARVERCQFRRACLTRAYFGARITDCDFTGSILQFARVGQNVQDVHVHYRGNDFSHADLDGLDAAGAYLAKTCFRSAHVTGARLSRADLSDCDLRGTNLAETNLTRACLAGACMTNATLDDCSISPDVAAKLREEGAQHVHGPVIVAHTVGQRVARLENVVQDSDSCNLRWTFHYNHSPCKEMVVIWKDSIVACSSGAGAFDADGVCLRTYPWGAETAMSAIFLDIAADYANWKLDVCSAEFVITPCPIENEIAECLRGALTEVFAAGSCNF